VLKNDNGNIAIFFALLLPLLLGFVGAGVDYARYNFALSELQGIADSAALAGAREYVIKSKGAQIPLAVAQQIADAGIAASNISAMATVTGSDKETTITVAIGGSFEPSFMVGMFKNPLTVAIDATAQAVGGANICVIALEQATEKSLSLDDNAVLNGAECAIYSNSKSAKGMSSLGAAALKTAFNCSAGGYEGGVGSFDPAVTTDCPPQADPLEMRAAPAFGACDLVPNLVKDITTTLAPGVYCGGLTIDGTAFVTFEPGIYIIKDGNFDIKASARVEGDGVGFYFDGATSILNIEQGTTISLVAPTSGEMAGLLIFQDRGADQNLKYTISSNNAETLVGTIYIPNGRLYIDATAPVAAASAYTAIIARRLGLASSANLVLNSDYGATDVPVPAGLANAGGSVRLRE